MDKNSLSPYVRLATYSVIPSPHLIRERIIFDYEIIFVKDGGCRIVIDGIEYLCSKNNVIFLRPDVKHAIYTLKDTDLVQPHIHFDMIYNEKSAVTPISFKVREDMTNDELGLIQQDILSETNIPYVFTPENMSAFQKCFFSIINTFDEQPNSLTLKADMLSLLNLIITQFEDNLQNKSRDISETVKSYIDGNFYNILSLDSIANIFYINKFTMMRRFKSVYGMNVIQYYNKKRADEAKRLLINTNMSIKDIGSLFNFTDEYSFSKFFKKCTGIPPSRYRRQ